ncbi:MAG: helix-turn-helix domain-containing protein [Dehalococcoidia bacterium]|nr:helix-turn-helix domain-containing protein [Dehalococcoidia bacterium]
MEEKVLLRPLEAAEALGIGRTKMYELLASGELPKVQIGRCIRVPVHGLKQWAEKQTIVGVTHES